VEKGRTTSKREKGRDITHAKTGVSGKGDRHRKDTRRVQLEGGGALCELRGDGERTSNRFHSKTWGGISLTCVGLKGLFFYETKTFEKLKASEKRW